MRINDIFRGRYGIHLISVVCFSLAGWFLLWRIIMPAGLNSYGPFLSAALLLGLGIWRCFSRNIYKRRYEDQAFAYLWRMIWGRIKGLWGRFTSWLRGLFTGKPRPGDDKKIIACPACGGKLRVPRGKGRIRIKCPHCGNSFEDKT